VVAGSGNPVIIATAGGRQRRLATPRHWRAAIEKGELGRDTSVALERGGQAAQIVTAGEIPELQDLFDEVLPASPAPPQSTPPPASADKVVAPAPARKQEAKPAAADAASAQAGPVDQKVFAGTMPPDEPARDKPTGCRSSAVFFPVLVFAFLMLIFVSIGNDDKEYQDVMVNEPAYEEPAYEEPAYEAPALDDFAAEPLESEETAALEPLTPMAQPLSTPTPTTEPKPTPVKNEPLNNGSSIAERRSLARPAQRDNYYRWASRIVAEGYPQRAIRREIQGSVGVSVVVDASGRVSSCTVTASSGESVLDEGACQAMERYARYEPALNDAGNPTTGRDSLTITYRLN